MDKNTFNGLLLIAFLFIAYSLLVKPPDKKPTQGLNTDSTSVAIQGDVAQQAAAVNNNAGNAAAATSRKAIDGLFAESTTEEQFFDIENDLLKITLSNKGGRVYKVQLKNYVTHDSMPLLLMDGPQNRFNYILPLQRKFAQTQDYFFEKTQANKNGMSMRLYTDSTRTQYIEQIYTLKEGSYMVDYDLNLVGFDQEIMNNTQVQLDWKTALIKQEKSMKAERMTTGMYYKDTEDVNYLSETSNDEENVDLSLEWISMKQQFFNATLIADKPFQTGKLAIKAPSGIDDPMLELASADLRFEYKQTNQFNFPMHFYFGPNDYSLLKSFDKKMEEMIPLGWGIFGWCNRWIIIPMFNFLNKYIGSYGIIILVLTLIIKMVLFPLTYRSYRSMAKMGVLKPQLDKLREKYGEDPQKMQTEQMKLYGQAGVNPIGGCLPQLIQLPILIAMYRFFPASIELRQQAFLWANDLSTYDSIMELPFNIPMYGAHVSLFCLLSALSSLLYMKVNQQMTPDTGNAQMAAQMKMFQYIMPVMLLFFFNSFSAGLTYYFLLSNLFGFGQSVLIKKFLINDEVLLKEIEENKKKPKKPSKFAERMEQMMREQEQMKKGQQNGKSKKGSTDATDAGGAGRGRGRNKDAGSKFTKKKKKRK